MKNLDYEVGSSNVYEDLGYEESAEMKIKAQAVRVIAKYIDTTGITQQELADILGIDQPRISRILRGQFSGVSLDKFISYLLALGKDIDITISETKKDSIGHLNIRAA